jgi:broad specificity phosphatase PhoE/CTP:molybdopterin cytidylyltransferase MocA
MEKGKRETENGDSINDQNDQNNQKDQIEGKNKWIGLILAAGFSSRMGRCKPLLTIGDETAFEWVSHTLKKAGVQKIVGVTGFQRENLSSLFRKEELVEAFNKDFEQGMFTSIKAGIRKALEGQGERPEGFFLMLVDCPLVPPEVLRMIMDKHEKQPDAFIVPCFRGKKGHPLFIPFQYAEEILAYDGDGGLKAITSRYEEKLVRLEAGLESVVLDMDTPEGYEEILAYYHSRVKQAAEGSGRTKADQTGNEEDYDFAEQLKGKRLFFIRHGEIRQHREKIFLGQADIPLSEKGKEQAREAAADLDRYHIQTNRIYTSDLLRAAETAGIIKDYLDQSRQKLKKPFRTPHGTPAASEGCLGEMNLITEQRLREMSLGEWDGKFISEIRERYPEEFEKRGQNLLTYKFGHESENFYDLQYRALKGLRSILKQEQDTDDEAGDILIVSHWGVINVLLSSLHHAELGEEIKKPIPNGGVLVMDYTWVW